MTIAAPQLNKTGLRFLFSHRLLTRFATVGDQMLVAVANFWLTISIARAFAPEALAAYGIGLSAGLIVQGLQRHTLIIPFMLQPRARSVRRAGGMMAQHWIILSGTLALGAAGILVSAEFSAPHYTQYVIGSSAVCLLIFAELEFARAILVTLNAPISLLAGAAYYSLLCAALGLSALMGWISFPALLSFMAAGMIFHATGITLKTGGLRLGHGWAILRSHSSRYGLWSVVASGTYTGYTHVPLFILGIFAPPIHAAAFVATRSLMQPLQIFQRGLDIADKAGFVDRAGTPYGRNAFHITLRLAALYTAAGCIFGLGVGLFPETLLQLAYGSKFAGERAALIAWVPVFVLLSSVMPIESLVYARRSFRGYYLARGAGSVVAIALTAPLIGHFDETGAIVASAVGSLVAAVGAVYLLARGTQS